MRPLLILLVLCLSALGCGAQTRPLLPIDSLGAIADSVVAEGLRLYRFDKMNWIGSDAYRSQCSHRTATVNLVSENRDSTLTNRYIDTRTGQCVMQCSYDPRTGEATVADSVRPLTATERKALDRHLAVLRGVEAQQDSLTPLDPAIGSLNLVAVPLNDSITRAYFIQGTQRDKLIPFGNDCSMDFDRQGHMVAFRRYHRSFIPIDFSKAKGNIRKCTHSHLEGSPYVTPTDVATFMLYGHDLYLMNTFSVYSLQLDCYFTFDARLGKIITQNGE